MVCWRVWCECYKKSQWNIINRSASHLKSRGCNPTPLMCTRMLAAFSPANMTFSSAPPHKNDQYCCLMWAWAYLCLAWGDWSCSTWLEAVNAMMFGRGMGVNCSSPATPSHMSECISNEAFVSSSRSMNKSTTSSNSKNLAATSGKESRRVTNNQEAPLVLQSRLQPRCCAGIILCLHPGCVQSSAGMGVGVQGRPSWCCKSRSWIRIAYSSLTHMRACDLCCQLAEICAHLNCTHHVTTQVVDETCDVHAQRVRLDQTSVQWDDSRTHRCGTLLFHKCRPYYICLWSVIKYFMHARMKNEDKL